MDSDKHTSSGRSVLALGLASPLLLAASLVWAHHWNPATVALVAVWCATMLGTPAAAIRIARRQDVPRRAQVGLWVNGLTWFALGFLVFLLLLGADVPSCGGG
jgi:hypothetical protein